MMNPAESPFKISLLFQETMKQEIIKHRYFENIQ